MGLHNTVASRTKRGCNFDSPLKTESGNTETHLVFQSSLEDMFIAFREREKGGRGETDRQTDIDEKETSISCLPHAP